MKLDVLVDEALAQALPALRPLAGKRIELIVLETPVALQRVKFEEFTPVDPPGGVDPVSLQDMERSIIGGPVKRAGV